MRCRRILYYRGIIYVTAVLCAVGNVIYSNIGVVAKELEMTALDAVLIYAMVGLKRLVLPFLIAYVNMHRFKYDFQYPYIVRSGSRLRLWYSQVMSIVLDCIVVTVLAMIAGAITGYIRCDVKVDFYSPVSVCREEFRIYGISVPQDMNIPVMIVETFIVNAEELMVRTLFTLFIYWITGSRIISLIVVYIISKFAIGDMGIKGIVRIGKIGTEHVRYYSALYFPAQVFETFIFLAAIILIVLLTAHIFIPAKEFVKKQQ